MRWLLRLLLVQLPDALLVLWKSLDWPVVGIFIGTQFIYTHLLGAGFVTLPVFYFQQYLDPVLLRTDLWMSLLYLHAQPPLMNLAIGFLFHWFPVQADFDVALANMYYLAGLAGVYWLNAGMKEIGLRGWIRYAVIVWLCSFPTFALFARWAYTTHIEFSICCYIFYALARMQKDPALTFRAVLSIGIPFCLLGLLRAQWHPVIFVAWIAFLFWLRARRVHVRECIKATVITMSPLLLLFAKNAVLFGVFGASSWTGMNFSGPVANSINTEILVDLKNSGQVSRDFPVYFRHEKALAVYRRWEAEGRALPISAHPSMRSEKVGGRLNYNYQAYIEGGKQDMADSLAILRNNPGRYITYVLEKMQSMTSVPSISYHCCAFNMKTIREWDTDYADMPHEIRYAVRMGSRVLYGVIPLMILAGAFWPRGNYLAQRQFFILSGFFLVLASYAVSCATSHLEQERIRWSTIGFYVAYAAMLLEAILRWREAKKN